MIARLALLGVLLAGAVLVLNLYERRPGMGGHVRRRVEGVLAEGVWLVVREGCRLCGPARSALQSAGVDPGLVSSERADAVGVKSVPTALVVDCTGSVVLRRSGRSVLTDAAAIVDVARSAGLTP